MTAGAKDAALRFPSLPLGRTAAGLTDSEAEILAFEHELTLAQDMESLTAKWAEDSSLFDIAPGAVIGLDAIRKNLALQYQFVESLETTIINIRVEASGDLGVAYSIQRIVGRGRNGAPDIAFVFRMTNCFRREGSRWLLFHQHVSLPVDLASGKAVTNSQ